MIKTYVSAFGTACEELYTACMSYPSQSQSRLSNKIVLKMSLFQLHQSCMTQLGEFVQTNVLHSHSTHSAHTTVMKRLKSVQQMFWQTSLFAPIW